MSLDRIDIAGERYWTRQNVFSYQFSAAGMKILDHRGDEVLLTNRFLSSSCNSYHRRGGGLNGYCLLHSRHRCYLRSRGGGGVSGGLADGIDDDALQ